MKEDRDAIKKAEEEERNKKAHKYQKKCQKDYQRIRESIQEFNAGIKERQDKSCKYRIKLEAYKIGNFKLKYVHNQSFYISISNNVIINLNYLLLNILK